ncbi:conserved Plasmodium protein, unknown function [Plasmodium gallinaceum]|uniref:Uncharacterized protein n=1 Tax=Plasmodium gallinaceum TaxID=5849 RepID=A0A1J1GPF2_PLAGA|nr:conserved Plasmodium protein, unknown function [Plasmodium gallinaceum]CRG94375.1 conserved Plasmodium protein, unknown function [Plasmodium gallinaceum]
MKKILLNNPFNNILRIFKRYENSTKLKIKEYEECLKNLSNHNKLLRIDINGKEKKISKYFFDKNKYIYVKNKDDIKAFDNKAKIENTDIYVIKKSLKKERKLQKSLKTFKDTYDLSQEEFIYMKFIYKIKIKNIFSLINNLRKNIYIDRQKEKILLNCIYKYLSYNCYVLSKNEFFFFIYIFPQHIKYSNKVVYYLTKLLENNQIDIDECLTLMVEINLLNINYHIRNKYIDYINRNKNKIHLFHIFDLLTKGSYMFSILLNHSNENKDFIFIENILNTLKDKKVVFNEEIKNKYINFISVYANNNIYLKTFFNDIYILLYKKIFLENYNYIKDNDYIKNVIKLTNDNIILRHINSILLMNNRQTILNSNKNVKIKVFPSFLEEKKENKTQNIDINSINYDNISTYNVKNVKDNINKMHSNINGKKYTNKKENLLEEKKNNTYCLNKFSSEYINNINNLNEGIYTKENYINRKNNNLYNKKITCNKSKNICINNNKQNIFNNNNNNKKNQNLIYEEKFTTKKESISNILQTKKNIFYFTYASDKIKSSKYEELKEKYKIPTKITDKNVKILLKFLKMSFHSKNSYLNEIFDKKNIFQIMSNIKNMRLKYDKNDGNFVKLFNQFSNKWSHIGFKKTIHENLINSHENEKKETTDKLENNFLPVYLRDTMIDRKKEKTKIDINKMKKSSDVNLKYYLISSFIKKNKFSENDIHLYECFNNSLDSQNKNNFFNFNIEKKENSDILNLVKNIYFNVEYNNKIYYKSQINSISKFLFYLCRSIESYFENIINYDTKDKITNLNYFTKTFYEIFTFVLKNINHINISNYFYIFASLSKFVNISLISDEQKKNNKNDYNSKTSNLLYIIYLVKKYEYNIIKNILNDKNNQDYFLYSEYDKNNINEYKKLNYETLHASILNNFKINNLCNSGNLKNRLLLKKDTINDLENENDIKYINDTNDITNRNNINIINKNDNSNSIFYNYIFINSYNFIIMYLNNYLDFSKFKMKKFLICIFYLYEMIPFNIKFIYHLESKLYKNHMNFINRYFYIYNGLNENKILLNEQYLALIKEYYLNEYSDNNLINSTENLIYNYKCNIYDNIENIFKNKKKIFLLEDTLNFTFIYSLNKFFYSTIYYEISKHLYKFDITFLNAKTKMLLFFLFFQCKNVYKPFLFLLLNDIIKCNQNLGRINLYILCNLILILIKDSKIRIKNVNYVKRKYSKFQCNYFFPLELFVLKNLLIFVEKRIKNLEKNIESRETRINTIKEKINVNNLFIFNIKYFKDDLKFNIPLLIENYKKYCQIKNVKEKNNINNNFSSFFYFDDVIESEIFKNSLNFLSFDYVMENFQISKKSIYYDLLCHLKKKINII